MTLQTSDPTNEAPPSGRATNRNTKDVSRRLLSARRLLASAMASEEEARRTSEEADRVLAVQVDMVRRLRSDLECLERMIERGERPAPEPRDVVRPILAVVRASDAPIGAKVVRKRLHADDDVSLGTIRTVLKDLARKGTVVEEGVGKYVPAP